MVIIGVEHYNVLWFVSMISHSSEHTYIEIFSVKSVGNPYPFKVTIAPPAIDELIAVVVKAAK